MVLVASVYFSSGVYVSSAGYYVFQFSLLVRTGGGNVVVVHALVGSSDFCTRSGGFFVGSPSNGVARCVYIVPVFF